MISVIDFANNIANMFDRHTDEDDLFHEMERVIHVLNHGFIVPVVFEKNIIPEAIKIISKFNKERLQNKLMFANKLHALINIIQERVLLIDSNLKSHISSFEKSDINNIRETETKSVIEYINMRDAIFNKLTNVFIKANRLIIIDTYFSAGEKDFYARNKNNLLSQIIGSIETAENNHRLKRIEINSYDGDGNKPSDFFCRCTNEKTSQSDDTIQNNCVIYDYMKSIEVRSKKEKEIIFRVQKEKEFKRKYHGRYLIVSQDGKPLAGWYMEKGVSAIHDVDKHPESFTHEKSMPLNVNRLEISTAKVLISNIENDCKSAKEHVLKY